MESLPGEPIDYPLWGSEMQNKIRARVPDTALNDTAALTAWGVGAQ